MQADHDKLCEVKERAQANFNSVAAQTKELKRENAELKRENAVLLDQMKKLGGAHVENSELGGILNQQSAEIKQLTEKLAAVQAQVCHGICACTPCMYTGPLNCHCVCTCTVYPLYHWPQCSQ